MNEPRETNELAALVERKHACLCRLREMGARQLELVRGGEMTALLDVLAAKQRLIGELQQIERALDPFRGEDADARHWPTPDERRRCAERLAECQSLLAEIVRGEKEGESELVRRRDEAAQQLQGAHVASQARGAYHAATPRSFSQLDLMSES
ncbi:MAG: hypothetical protein NTW96_13065 [Planctomycetia bacterium]|nr:hypothetical protein [Planctomycetia bacterium]